MFRTRSEYINEKSSYTDIRNGLHRAFREKGASAGVRFKDGQGLYVLERKSWLRRQFDTQDDVARRQLRFSDAKDKIIEAIDREYQGWEVDGQRLSSHVMGNLRRRFKGNRLDEHALKIIDHLIEKGMERAKEVPLQEPTSEADERRQWEKRQWIVDAKFDRQRIFSHLEEARRKEAERNWLQRQWAKWSGDHVVDRLADRAANWRNITNGNRLLRAAIVQDLWASGHPGNLREEARSIIKQLGLRQTGLTPKSRTEVINCLRDRKCRTDHLENLGDYVRLKQNLAVNSDQLRQINAGIEKVQRERLGDSIDSKANTDPVLHAVRQNEELLRVMLDSHDYGELEDPHRRDFFYEQLRVSNELLNDLRSKIDTTDPYVSDLDCTLAALLEEYMAASYDLALALCDSNERGEHGGLIPFHLPSSLGRDPLADINRDPLADQLPSPKVLFRSEDRGGRVVVTREKIRSEGRNGKPVETMEQTYNKKCTEVVETMIAYDRTRIARDHQRLCRALNTAGQLNDDLTRQYTHQSALGGKAHAQMLDRLGAQRRTLQRIQLALIQSGRTAIRQKSEARIGYSPVPGANTDTGSSEPPAFPSRARSSWINDLSPPPTETANADPKSQNPALIRQNSQFSTTSGESVGSLFSNPDQQLKLEGNTTIVSELTNEKLIDSDGDASKAVGGRNDGGGFESVEEYSQSDNSNDANGTDDNYLYTNQTEIESSYTNQREKISLDDESSLGSFALYSTTRKKSKDEAIRQFVPDQGRDGRNEETSDDR